MANIDILFCSRGGAAGNKLKMTLGLPVYVETKKNSIHSSCLFLSGAELRSRHQSRKIFDCFLFRVNQ